MKIKIRPKLSLGSSPFYCLIQMNISIWDSIWNSVGITASKSVWDGTRSSIRAQTSQQIYDSSGSVIIDPCWHSIRESVHNNVWRELKEYEY